MSQSPENISTRQLQHMLGKPAVKVIDIRPVEAYNGWILKNEQRGGHIQGAKSLPEKWLNYLDWIEIVRHKNFLPDDEIAMCDEGLLENRKFSFRSPEIEAFSRKFSI